MALSQDSRLVKSQGRTNVHLPYTQQIQAHHRVVARLADKYTPEGRVLDVGCGLGYTLRELHELNPRLELFGADEDEECLRRSHKQVPGVQLIRMKSSDQARRALDTESLGSGYDAVIMSHVLEHVSCPLDAVHRLMHIVHPGGHVILAVPNPVNPAVILASLRRRPAVNPGHLQTWDRSHWMNFLERGVGSEVVEYASDEVRIFPMAWRQRARLLQKIQLGLAGVLPWFSFSNIAVVRRAETGTVPRPLIGLDAAV